MLGTPDLTGSENGAPFSVPYSKALLRTFRLISVSDICPTPHLKILPRVKNNRYCCF